MKQEINLYQDAMLKTESRLSFLHMMQAMGAFLLLISIVTVWKLIAYYGLQSDLNALQGEQSLLEQKIKTEKQMAPSDQEKKNISKKVKDLEDKRELNQLLINTLNELQLKESLRFSKYFDALSQASAGDTALQKFTISKGGNGISLHGAVLEPENVPKLLKRLGQDPMFRDKVFETFKVDSIEGESDSEFTVESDV